MKYLPFLLVINFIFLLSCSSSDINNPSSNVNFSVLWETPITPTGGDNIPQGIVVDKLGRDYLYVSEKANGVSVYKKSTGEKITNIAISSFGNHHAMHIKQQGNYLVYCFRKLLWRQCKSWNCYYQYFRSYRLECNRLLGIFICY